MSSNAVYLLLPELILALAASLVYVGGAFVPARRAWSIFSAAALAMAAFVLARQQITGATSDEIAPLVTSAFSTTIRGAVLGVGLVFLLFARQDTSRGESTEYLGSLVLVVSGLMLLASAADLALLFVALELVSIPTYVLLYLGVGSHSQESGAKYFFLSILASAVMLYGFSFLYGATGSTNLNEIRATLAAADADATGVSAFAPVAAVLIFTALAFRLTAVPFHFYAPDVYQGTTNSNAAFLSVIPKIAGLVVLVRIVYVSMPGVERLGWQLSLALAMVTMTLGNLLALWQSNIRRMLAYSSVAHAGYLLIGLAVSFAVAGGTTDANPLDGLGATLFYLLVYAAATIGSFAALTWLSSRNRSLDNLVQLEGLSEFHPLTAAALAVFMFSLTGLPPFAGFWGKLALFTGALGVDARNPQGDSLWPWFVALAIVGALNAAISAAYYLRLVALMYFRPPQERPEPRGSLGAACAVATCVFFVLGIGLIPGPFVAQSDKASQAARATQPVDRAVAAQVER